MCTMLTHRAPPVSRTAGDDALASAAPPPAAATRHQRRRHSKDGEHAVRHLGALRVSLPPRCTLVAFCLAIVVWILLLYLYLGLERAESEAKGGAWPTEPNYYVQNSGGRHKRDGSYQDMLMRQRDAKNGDIRRHNDESTNIDNLYVDDDNVNEGVGAHNKSLRTSNASVSGHNVSTKDGSSDYDASLQQNETSPELSDSEAASAELVIDSSVALTNAQLARLGRPRNAEQRKQRQDGYSQHAFNTLVSDRLGLLRALPDTRHRRCQQQSYLSMEQLPTVSVIICFYNEHTTTLLRSLTTVLQRSPDALLREVILVDDASDIGGLTEAIEAHIEQNALDDKVRLLRSEERLGLIRARLHGAAHASSKVLVFLDSHIEVNVDWLPPLLTPIATDRRTITVPVVDVINADTFVYTSSPLVRGGFTWDMHFTWVALSEQQKQRGEFFFAPFDTPAMPGGLFAMDRQYFYELGGYDEGMDIWGGENLELSFRAWTCGGRLQIAPCSRIGHVFRKRRPYQNPEGTRSILQNLLRLVLVWLDDYREHFFDAFPEAAGLEYGDVSGRLALRRRLGCRPFAWYLAHVYPELEVPATRGRQLGGISTGGRRGAETGPVRLRRAGTDYCLQPDAGGLVMMKECAADAAQVFHETVQQELRWRRRSADHASPGGGLPSNRQGTEGGARRSEGAAADELCLTAGEHTVTLERCHLQNGDQQWNYAARVGSPVFNLVAGKCLAASGRLDAPVTMDTCSEDASFTWDILAGSANVENRQQEQDSA